MKLNQAVKICGEILSLGLSEEYFAHTQTATPEDKNVQLLVTAAGFVTEELFADYGANVYKKTASTVDGTLAVANLCKVLSLTDAQSGNDVAFRYTAQGLYVGRDGKFDVVYTTKPTKPSWTEEVPLPSTALSDRTVVYGMIAEFFLMSGDSVTAEPWRVRFEDTASAATVKTSSVHMPARRWL